MVFRSPSHLSARYQLLRLVGQGQFGRVFCARHRQTNQLVALKEISWRHSTSQFLRELAFVASLQHPHIVTWQGLEQTASGRYLVMDYCEAGTLRDLLNTDAQLVPLQCLGLIADILAGLIYIHAKGIVHCDLKPENILLHLTPQGWLARVADFNVAQWQAELGLKDSVGTPAYMAPEQFYGEPSVATDVYAIGVILFELLLKCRPFEGQPGGLMTAHLSQTPPVPSTLPFLVQSILTCALQKLPQRRFTSAQKMLQAVQMALQVEHALQPSQELTVHLPIMAKIEQSRLITRQQPMKMVPTALAACETQVYFADQRQLTLLGMQTGPVVFDEPIVQLCPHHAGCWVTTRTPDGQTYRLYHFRWLTDAVLGPFRLQWRTHQLICLADPQGYWLATVQIAALDLQQAILQIWRLPHLKLVRSLKVSAPQNAAVLNQRYGLLVLPEPYHRQGAQLQIFHRRGGWAGKFSVPVSLGAIVSSRQHPAQLLAIPTEQAQQVILINLCPFRLTRIYLNFTPTLLTATQQYYVLLNSVGQGIVLDSNGVRTMSFDLGEKGPVKIRAIAPLMADTVLIAGCWQSQEQLVTLNLEGIRDS